MNDFYLSIVNDDLENVKLICPSNLNYHDSIGLSPLALAVYHQKWKIVDYLLFQGADPNFVDPFGNTPIFSAVQHPDAHIIASLVINGAKVNIENNNHETPLYLAVSSRNYNAIRLLLIEVKNMKSYNDRVSPLIKAAHLGDFFIYQLIYDISNEKEIDLSFLVAIAKGHQEIIKFLIREGRDLNFLNQYAVVPLQTAIHYANYQVIKLLVKSGARLINNNQNEYKMNSLIHSWIGNSLGDKLKLHQYIFELVKNYDKIRDPHRISKKYGTSKIIRAIETKDLGRFIFYLKQSPKFSDSNHFGTMIDYILLLGPTRCQQFFLRILSRCDNSQVNDLTLHRESTRSEEINPKEMNHYLSEYFMLDDDYQEKTQENIMIYDENDWTKSSTESLTSFEGEQSVSPIQRNLLDHDYNEPNVGNILFVPNDKQNISISAIASNRFPSSLLPSVILSNWYQTKKIFLFFLIAQEAKEIYHQIIYQPEGRWIIGSSIKFFAKTLNLPGLGWLEKRVYQDDDHRRLFEELDLLSHYRSSFDIDKQFLLRYAIIFQVDIFDIHMTNDRPFI